MGERYIISDVAKFLEIEPHVLRYWEDELELKIQRNQLGHRYYSKKNIELLKQVKIYKDKGFQLKAIKLMVSGDDNKIKKEQLFNISKDVSTVDNESPQEVNYKLKQFQDFINNILQNTLKENNEILKRELVQEVAEEIQSIAAKTEELDEKRFRKLDETIREMQKTRQEAALAKSKSRWLFKRS